MAARRVRKRSGRRVVADEAADDGAVSAEEQSAPEDVAMEDADATDGSGAEDSEAAPRDDGKDEEEDEDGDEQDAAAPVARRPARRRKPPRELRGDRPRRRRRDQRFNLYIYRVLKQVHQHIGISNNGMKVMNSFVQDMFEKIMMEAQTLTQYQRKQTMTHREVTAAAKLVLFGELAKHAESEANKALRSYTVSMQAENTAAKRGKKKGRAGKAPARRGERRNKR